TCSMISLIFSPLLLSAIARRIETVRSADCTRGFGAALSGESLMGSWSGMNQIPAAKLAATKKEAQPAWVS
ncbi:MAG TPA: hypothetical protein VGR96_17925, partial [Acidobacteriaceae bacterium]|nr:hypothetical protein [Acidobacteriaceae bacterium]